MLTRRLSFSVMFSIGALLGVAMAVPIQVKQEIDDVVGQCLVPQPIDTLPITRTSVSPAPESTSILSQASSMMVSMVSSSALSTSLPPQYPAPVPTTTVVSNIQSQSTTVPADPTGTPIMAPIVTPVIAPVIAPFTTGQAIVKNTCSFDIQVQSVAGTEAGPVVSLRVGETYSENYHNGPNGSGVAIKCIKDGEDWSAPMLLEYTPNLDMGLVFYDMSVSVGGNMQGHGGIGDTYVLTPSTVNQGTACVPVTYAESYIHVGESDSATKSCSISTSITLNLC